MPLLGSYIFMLILNHKHLHRAIERLCEFYESSVIGLHLGSLPVIAITDLENTKKALNHRDFDGRPDFLGEITVCYHISLNLYLIFFFGDFLSIRASSIRDSPSTPRLRPSTRFVIVYFHGIKKNHL